MKIKTICSFFVFAYSLVLNGIKIQPIGDSDKPLEIRSLAHLKALANANEKMVKKITANPFPIKTTSDVLKFSCLCPHWTTWNVFSDEEFYEGNCSWLQYTSFINKKRAE